MFSGSLFNIKVVTKVGLFISFPSNLTKMKFSSTLTICVVLFLGLTLSEAKKGGKGKKGFWGKH